MQQVLDEDRLILIKTRNDTSSSKIACPCRRIRYDPMRFCPAHLFVSGLSPTGNIMRIPLNQSEYQ